MFNRPHTKHRGLLAFRGMLPFLGILLAMPAGLTAQNIDTADLDGLIIKNRQDLEFLDVPISNLPADNELKPRVVANLAEAVKLDFIGRIWRLQGKTGDSFRQLAASRVALREGYRRILGYYTDTAWVLLEASAPGIVRSGDVVAEHYLKLAFRDLEVARILYRQGVRYPIENPTLALRAYADGIFRIRMARRYGLLALIESRTPLPEKDRFRTVSLDDLRENNGEEKDQRTRYEVLFDRLTNLVSRKILGRNVESDSRGYMIKLDLFEIHEDNYGHILSSHESELDHLFANLSIGDYHREESLPRRNTLNRFDVPASQSDPIKPLRDSNLKESPGDNKPPGRSDGPAEKKPEAGPEPQPNNKAPAPGPGTNGLPPQ